MNKGFGIKRGYPRLRRYFGKFMDYISLLRLFTLIAPLMAGITGSYICLGGDIWSRWLEVVYVSFTLVLCQAAGQVINQASGSEDKINKPYRPIPQGRVTEEEAYGLGFLLVIIAAWRGFMVNAIFGGWILLILFFAIFYNLEPIKAKKYLWINVLWMAISRGLLPFVVIWSAFGDPFTVKPWLLGSIAFFWVLAFQPTKDLGDIEGDREYGIKTLPVVYGVEKTEAIIKWLSILPFIPLILYIKSGLLPLSYLLLFALVLIREIGIRGFGEKLEYLENDVSWAMFYLGLSLIFILSVVAEILS